MTPEERIEQLEVAIRKHRDAQGQDLCWENDVELWAVLGDGVVPDRKVPPWPEFMAGCVRYRQMLDREPKLARPVFGGLPWANRLSRSIIEVQKLPDGALPIYDKDPDVVTAVMSEDAPPSGSEDDP